VLDKAILASLVKAVGELAQQWARQLESAPVTGTQVAAS